jgi:chemotaxis protein MotB
MAAGDSPQPRIVIRRPKRGGAGHHGGVWKIAYADFVTAMMAFFLLMWLLSSTSQGDLQGIADYFKTPLKIALSRGDARANSTSVLKGGGKDVTQREGQVRKSDPENDRKTALLKAAESELDRRELARLQELKRKIERAIDANPTLKQFKHQLLLDITTEGLRIQIVDERNRPMFAVGQAVLVPYTREILREIGKTLNDVPNRVSLAGHTDATQYSFGEKYYSNWELSADRANASRRELIAGGMNEIKVLRVVGLSSAVMLDKADPYNPINRRISIIVMNKKAEEAITRDGASLDVRGSGDVDRIRTPEPK